MKQIIFAAAAAVIAFASFAADADIDTLQAKK